ncbi:MAG: sodium-dependent transporter [Marinifilaceae bacterium]|jgi:NSS family neurotransmitter:Na+ symporter|nr:sodium-dependent transporter [Marinifilaceae bacterium]
MAGVNNKREQFTSKFGVMAAAAGSAVGLGNIWRFPYIVGENGGGAFLLVYLCFIILIGLPVMLTEILIGRRAQANAYTSFSILKPNTRWKYIGVMGIIAAFLILAFYSTIAGWTLEYFIQSVFWTFQKGESSNIFTQFKSSTLKPLILQFVFLLMTAFIVYSGVKKGIERYTKFLMPILVIMILVICFRSLSLEGSMEGLLFLFSPDFSKLNFSIIIEALGQAAFSLSIGMGTLITYGSYIRKSTDISKISVNVTIADTLIAIFAGIMIFPAVFALGFNIDSGPGLVFVILPELFLSMPGGHFFAIVFFGLLIVAALTSTISILEVIVAFLSEHIKLGRKKACLIAISFNSIFGVLASLSFSELSFFEIFGLSIFELMEYIAANILLPLGALLIVVFAAYVLKRKIVKNEISSDNLYPLSLFNIYWFLIKYVAPLAIIFVFIKGIGLI